MRKYITLPLTIISVLLIIGCQPKADKQTEEEVIEVDTVNVENVEAEDDELDEIQEFGIIAWN